MKQILCALSILLFATGFLPAVTPVAVSFDPALPKGWTMNHQQPTAANRETVDDQTTLISPDRKTTILLQASTKRNPSQTFEAAAEAWKQEAVTIMRKMGLASDGIEYVVSPHRTGKQATLSLIFSAGDKKGSMVSKFWFENGFVVGIAARSQADIRKDSEIFKILDSIRVSPASKPSVDK